MTTIFLSGSRNISRLNDVVRSRIQNMIDKEFHIILGDANGADKAMQHFLADSQYKNITVFCAGNKCRNNVGKWDIRRIEVDQYLKGRAFYTQKDKKMAGEADYGFVLWDGKSAGSINNVFELLKRQKTVVVYLSSKEECSRITRPQDIKKLLETCNTKDYYAICKKTNMGRHLEDLQLSRQTAFGFLTS